MIADMVKGGGLRTLPAVTLMDCGNFKLGSLNFLLFGSLSSYGPFTHTAQCVNLNAHLNLIFFPVLNQASMQTWKTQNCWEFKMSQKCVHKRFWNFIMSA